MTDFRYLKVDEVAEMLPHTLQCWDDTRDWNKVYDCVVELGHDLFGFYIGGVVAAAAVEATKIARNERAEAHHRHAMLNLTDEDIVDLFDQNPDMLMSDMCEATGKSMKQLKQILMGEVA